MLPENHPAFMALGGAEFVAAAEDIATSARRGIVGTGPIELTIPANHPALFQPHATNPCDEALNDLVGRARDARVLWQITEPNTRRLMAAYQRLMSGSYEKTNLHETLCRLGVTDFHGLISTAIPSALACVPGPNSVAPNGLSIAGPLVRLNGCATFGGEVEIYWNDQHSVYRRPGEINDCRFDAPGAEQVFVDVDGNEWLASDLAAPEALSERAAA